MKKSYLVFTVNENKGNKIISTVIFDNQEDAIKRVDDYSEAEIKLQKNSEIIGKYGSHIYNDSHAFVPRSLFRMFFALDIFYGKTVKCFLNDNYYYTHRFVVEKEVQ